MFTVPIISMSVKKSVKKSVLQVCLLSPHPLVLSEFERVLADPAFKTISKHLESTLGPDLRHLPIPKATVYVVDAHVAKPAAGALLSNILDHLHGSAHHRGRRKIRRRGELLAAADGRRRDCSPTTEAREQLPRALPLVANGGFWVPRSVLSGFVDSILAGSHSRRLKVDTAADLSRRETGSSEFAAGESGQQGDREQAQYFRAHREISRLQFAEQVRRPPPRRPHSALLPEAQRHPLKARSAAVHVPSS